MTKMVVTPTLAKAWLENCNTHNRNMSKWRVNSYARTMREGLWRHPTGETIIFDTMGRLQDGQHRLAAQVMANATIEYWVMADADPDDFLAIGQGKTRSAGQIIAIQGVSSSRQVAAIARTYLLMITSAGKVWSGGLAHAPITPSMVVDFVQNHENHIVDAANTARTTANSTRVPITPFGAVGLFVSLQEPSSMQWHDFVVALKSGAELTANSPILALRKWALTRSTDHGKQQQQVAIISKAWNAHVTGRSVQRLVWQSSNLPMPLPIRPHY